MTREAAQRLAQETAKNLGSKWSVGVGGSAQVGFYAKLDNGPFWLMSSESPNGVVFLADCFQEAIPENYKISGMDRDPKKAIEQCLSNYGKWIDERKNDYQNHSKLIE